MQADELVLATFVKRIEGMTANKAEPLLVALDGRSGVGKSTLADAARGELPSCAVIEGDDFYAGGSAESWDARSAAAKAGQVIDWRRQHDVLTDLAAGRPGIWHEYDWEAFDGRLNTEPTTCEPAGVVILEGAYSARPELADLLHLRVQLALPDDKRLERLRRRDGDDYRDDWLQRWTEAEDLYFNTIMPPAAFDLVLTQTTDSTPAAE